MPPVRDSGCGQATARWSGIVDEIVVGDGSGVVGEVKWTGNWAERWTGNCSFRATAPLEW
jgi:hypothetical protein